MRIDNTQNINFSGILLSNSSFDKSKELVSFLRKACINVVGHKTYYVNNTFNSKYKTTQSVRAQYPFIKDECGIIFLPFSKEAWVISTPKYEQELYKLIKDFDKSTKINLLV